jgi:hypothetical protein
MASSSSQQDILESIMQEVPESTSQEAPAYEIAGRTMNIEEWDLTIQTENLVDLESLAFHGCNIKSFYEAQGLMDYFTMFNGPTYEAFVRHFWVWASIFNGAASEAEERQKVLLDPTLAGKTREEMGLEPYKGLEIRSNVLGIPIFIYENVVARVLRKDTSGQYEGMDIPNARTSSWKPIVNETI